MNYLQGYNDCLQNRISFDIYFSSLNMWTQTRLLFAKKDPCVSSPHV